MTDRQTEWAIGEVGSVTLIDYGPPGNKTPHVRLDVAAVAATGKLTMSLDKARELAHILMAATDPHQPPDAA